MKFVCFFYKKEEEERYEEGRESSFSDDSADDEDSDHETEKEPPRAATGPHSGPRPRHQAPALASRSHLARRRRHFTRKKKKLHVPVRLASDERVSVEVVSTETIVAVRWQDYTLTRDILSTELHPVLHVDDLEFFPGDFVVDKSNVLRVTCFGYL